MNGQPKRPATHVRLAVLGTMAVVLLLLAALVVMGSQTGAGARGTADAVGVYADPTPSATSTVTLSTGGAVATATGTETAIPTATSGPASAAFSATTPTPVASPTASPVPVSIKAQAITAVAQGQRITVMLFTLPRLHLTYTVIIGTHIVVQVGKAVSDSAGKVQLTFGVPIGPLPGHAPLPGRIDVQVSQQAFQGVLSIPLKVYAPLHLVTRAASSHVNGITTITVQVQIATKATVAVSVLSTGAHGIKAQGRGTADGRHTLLIQVPLKTVPAGTVAQLTITVTTTTGVHESRVIRLLLKT